MSSNTTFNARQLAAARTTLWHQDGNALQTMEAAQQWLESAGLVPFLPRAEQLPAPSASFVEAILGRPEKGHKVADPAMETPGEDESLAVDVEDLDPEEDEESEDDSEEDSNDDEDSDEEDSEEESEDSDDEDSDEEDEDEFEGADPVATDPEVMTTPEEEAEEDQGDEIALVDQIHADAEAVAKPAPKMTTVNGFTPEQMETARRMLARMIQEGAAVPLNLMGTMGDTPDFVCSAQAFSFIYTLRGDKGWKRPPATSGSMSVSTLALHVWEILNEKGEQTASQLVTELGREVTGAAVLRALTELWSMQRAIPLPQEEGTDTKWELLTGKFVRHIKAGANAGAPTALSALLSLYLNQVAAATTDEIEIALSPLAARSRIRDVVNGLSATQQLDEIVIDGKTVHYIADALPEMPEIEVASEPSGPRDTSSLYTESAPSPRSGDRAPRGARPSRPAYGGGRPAFSRGSGENERERRPFTRKPFTPREGGERRSFTPREGGGERRPFTPREGGGERRPFTPRGDGERRPFTPRDGGERRPFTPRGDGERRPFTPRGDGERRPFTPRGDGERRPFTPREGGGERRPFTPRGDGERRPFTPRDGGERRPFTPRGDGERRPFTPRGDGERRPFTPRGDGERRPFTPRGDGERRPFTPRGDGERRPFTPREGGGERRPFTPRGDGERRPFTPRDGGERRPFTPRGDGERRPFTPRGDGERRPFTPRGDGERRPFTPREGGERRPFTPRGDGERRPFTPRDGGERRPFTPRGDGERRPFTPREGGDRKPFGGGGFKPRTGGFSKGPFKGPGRGGPSGGFGGRGGAPKRPGGDRG